MAAVLPASVALLRMHPVSPSLTARHSRAFRLAMAASATACFRRIVFFSSTAPFSDASLSRFIRRAFSTRAAALASCSDA